MKWTTGGVNFLCDTFLAKLGSGWAKIKPVKLDAMARHKFLLISWLMEQGHVGLIIVMAAPMMLTEITACVT